jgi:hypothetical protein
MTFDSRLTDGTGDPGILRSEDEKVPAEGVVVQLRLLFLLLLLQGDVARRHNRRRPEKYKFI